ncbi:kit ligand isoform X1 [Pleurodeles waltl]|uniref:kit ligand isoform X1 n=1 Tax=Pleurodeles waltl TaxID=8319 RepID=UPI003709AB8A
MKKTKTWITTFIYLQLILCVTFGNPCGNPVTDAVNDIEKLVGNLPNDYNISLEYVPDMPSLPKQCWVYLMVHKVSNSLTSLIQKFANTSQNYSIMSNLTAILHGIRHCLTSQLDNNADFIEDFPFYDGQFVPKKYFEYVSKTILLFTDIQHMDHESICVLPTTTEMPMLASTISVTKPYAKFSFMPSRLRNVNETREQRPEPTGSHVLEMTYVALIAMSCLVVGFIIGVVCWKIKQRESGLACEPPVHCPEVRKDAEHTSMLNQPAKAVHLV